MKNNLQKTIDENKASLPVFFHLLKKIPRRFTDESKYRQTNSNKHQTNSLLIDDFYKSISRPINMTNAQNKR